MEQAPEDAPYDCDQCQDTGRYEWLRGPHDGWSYCDCNAGWHAREDDSDEHDDEQIHVAYY